MNKIKIEVNDHNQLEVARGDAKEEEWEAKEEDVDEFICGSVREINIDK